MTDPSRDPGVACAFWAVVSLCLWIVALLFVYGVGRTAEWWR